MTQPKVQETLEYFADSQTVCSCGAKHQFGSTQKQLSVEICANCHPFYTGTQKFIDSAGRLEKFKQRVDLAKKFQEKKKEKSKK